MSSHLFLQLWYVSYTNVLIAFPPTRLMGVLDWSVNNHLPFFLDSYQLQILHEKEKRENVEKELNEILGRLNSDGKGRVMIINFAHLV